MLRGGMQIVPRCHVNGEQEAFKVLWKKSANAGSGSRRESLATFHDYISGNETSRALSWCRPNFSPIFSNPQQREVCISKGDTYVMHMRCSQVHSQGDQHCRRLEGSGTFRWPPLTAGYVHVATTKSGVAVLILQQKHPVCGLY